MRLSFAILAAGRGTRMNNLTHQKNKCMLKFNGKPIIGYIAETLISAGADEINVIVHHSKTEIIDYLTNNFSIKFNFIEQEELQGTGQAVDLLRDINSNYVLVTVGDTIFDTTQIKKFVQEFNKNPANYILSTRVENPKKWGVLEVEGTKILSIIEKPENPPSNLINFGMYIFNKSIFEFTNKLQKSPKGEYWITDAIQASINAGNDFRHFIYEGEVLDFTYPEDFEKNVRNSRI
tara:strand:+ start:603 stop:1307 length:705 start_codon:yes stop_codon:yes gene_type:complete